MKITLITQYYKPEMGAPQNRLFEMSSGLKALGCDITVITGMPNYPTGKIFYDYKNKFFVRESVDNIEVLRYWLYASNSRKILPRIWNMLSFSITIMFSFFYLRKRKNDFIIVESPPLTLGIVAWVLAKMTKAKLITNISDLWPLSAKELNAINGDGFVYKFLEKIERFLYSHSTICLGQSQEIVDYIKKHRGKNTYLFRNGVDPERFKHITKKIRQPEEPLKIIYTGLLGYAQGILGVCKNIDFKSLGAEFHIYGAGGEEQAIKEYIEENRDNAIFFHGKTDREMIPTVLSKADCTLIPLVKNIFGAVPSKIYESMAAGLPILFSGEGEGRRIINENDIGWCSDSLNYRQLRENISLVVKNQNEILRKTENCIEVAQTKFNRPKQVENLYNFLKLNI